MCIQTNAFQNNIGRHVFLHHIIISIKHVIIPSSSLSFIISHQHHTCHYTVVTIHHHITPASNRSYGSRTYGSRTAPWLRTVVAAACTTRRCSTIWSNCSQKAIQRLPRELFCLFGGGYVFLFRPLLNLTNVVCVL